MMTNTAIAQHYERKNLAGSIIDALKAAGIDPDNLVPDDLAPIDEFHIRGLEATLEMIELAGFDPDAHVLDVGCGIGGPSRRLAVESGC